MKIGSDSKKKKSRKNLKQNSSRRRGKLTKILLSECAYWTKNRNNYLPRHSRWTLSSKQKSKN